jgi:hypothetical protein
MPRTRRRRGGSTLSVAASLGNYIRKKRGLKPYKTNRFGWATSKLAGNGVARMLAVPALAYLAYKNRDNLRSLASTAKSLPWRVRGSGRRRRRRSPRARGLLFRP